MFIWLVEYQVNGFGFPGRIPRSVLCFSLRKCGSLGA